MGFKKELVKLLNLLTKEEFEEKDTLLKSIKQYTADIVDPPVDPPVELTALAVNQILSELEFDTSSAPDFTEFENNYMPDFDTGLDAVFLAMIGDGADENRRLLLLKKQITEEKLVLFVDEQGIATPIFATGVTTFSTSLLDDIIITEAGWQEFTNPIVLTGDTKEVTVLSEITGWNGVWVGGTVIGMAEPPVDPPVEQFNAFPFITNGYAPAGSKVIFDTNNTPHYEDIEDFIQTDDGRYAAYLTMFGDNTAPSIVVVKMETDKYIMIALGESGIVPIHATHAFGEFRLSDTDFNITETGWLNHGLDFTISKNTPFNSEISAIIAGGTWNDGSWVGLDSEPVGIMPLVEEEYVNKVWFNTIIEPNLEDFDYGDSGIAMPYVFNQDKTLTSFYDSVNESYGLCLIRDTVFDLIYVTPDKKFYVDVSVAFGETGLPVFDIEEGAGWTQFTNPVEYDNYSIDGIDETEGWNGIWVGKVS